ncbi:MAG TPA: peptidoglycan recognition family protein [Solirubrobacteraceae bacterium]|nr:peptidoglycan recognition family protein [Solirubrobacteraceae bacterium]
MLAAFLALGALLWPAAGAAAPPRPPVTWRPIPFSAQRKREMRAYAQRHYGLTTYRLIHPRVIVEHLTENDSVSATWNTFAPDVPDPELHELPGTCAHFVIARDGAIFQLVPLGLMCRHTVGLNYTAVGIEHVGFTEQQVLSDPRQLAASLRLTAWLRCRYGIAVRDVIGHAESLTSPYHRERVARLRTQTHDDWRRPYMRAYRRKLAQMACR